MKKLLVTLALLAMIAFIAAACVVASPATIAVFSILAFSMLIAAVSVIATFSAPAVVRTRPPVFVEPPLRVIHTRAPAPVFVAPRSTVIHTRAPAPVFVAPRTVIHNRVRADVTSVGRLPTRSAAVFAPRDFIAPNRKPDALFRDSFFPKHQAVTSASPHARPFPEQTTATSAGSPTFHSHR